MKTKLTMFCAALLLVNTLPLQADDSPKPKQGSAEFEKMKTLVGSWKGTTDMGQGPIDMTVTYRVLAAGSVVEERVFAGTPNEMVTMYFDRDGKLALTHYCMLGNRPAMVLKSSKDKTLSFDFDKNCDINTAKETHMHSLTITFDNADTIRTSCKAMADGKECEGHEVTLKRVKAT